MDKIINVYESDFGKILIKGTANSKDKFGKLWNNTRKRIKAEDGINKFLDALWDFGIDLKSIELK